MVLALSRCTINSLCKIAQFLKTTPNSRCSCQRTTNLYLFAQSPQWLCLFFLHKCQGIFCFNSTLCLAFMQKKQARLLKLYKRKKPRQLARFLVLISLCLIVVGAKSETFAQQLHFAQLGSEKFAQHLVRTLRRAGVAMSVKFSTNIILN